MRSVLIYIGSGLCLQVFAAVVTAVEVCCYGHQVLHVPVFLSSLLWAHFELSLKKGLFLEAPPAETHCYHWRPISMVVGCGRDSCLI